MASQAAAASPQAAPSCAPGGVLEWQCCTGAKSIVQLDADLQCYGHDTAAR
jgi:hypothetical protein